MEFRARVFICSPYALPLHGEGCDSEDGGIGRGFRGKALDDAERFAENVRKVWPYVVHFRWQTGDQQ